MKRGVVLVLFFIFNAVFALAGDVLVDGNLEVNNANDAIIKIDSGSAQYSAVDFYENTVNKWGIGIDPSNDFYIDEAGTGVHRLIIKQGGDVGIGTDSPSARLDIVPASGIALEVGRVAGQPNIELTSDYGIIDSNAANGLWLNYWSDKKIILGWGGGNVGIGTDNPTERLDVVGQIHATDDICTDLSGGVCLSSVSSSLWTPSGSDIYYSGGNVGIGTAAPTQALDVDGNARFRSMICNGSDEKLYTTADGTLACGTDSNGTGDITDVKGGLGLTPDNCSSGSCTLDINTGAAATTGLEIVSDEIRLMDDGCEANETLKRNPANTGWECVAVGSGSSFWTPSGSDIYYDSGNVGIGTTTPGSKLEVVGGPIEATGGLIIETRTSDPASPVDGQIWLIVP